MTSVSKLYSGILVILLAGLSATVTRAEVYTVGVRAINGIDVALQQWGPTIEHLNSTVPGHKFILKPVVNLGKLNLMAGRGELDFVFTNPSSYVEMRVRYGMRALVTLNNRRSDTAQMRFGAVIFTHVLNEDILTLRDLRGRSLMAVSETAFGGWRVAWLELLENRIDPYRDMRKIVYSPRSLQKEVVYAVLDRRVDVGVVRTDMLERMANSKQIDLRYLRVINNKNVKDFPFFLSTRLYPEWPFAVAKSVPAGVANKVSLALQKIRPDSTAARSGKYIGWHAALSYKSVEDLMRRLRVGPWNGGRPAGISSQQGYIFLVIGIVLLLAVIGVALVRRSRAIESV